MFSSSQDILEVILKPQFKSKSSSWLQSASKNEIKGLKLIGAIFTHKGKKKFKTRSDSHRASLPNINSYESELRKRQLQSTYELEFGGSKAYHETNIFSYRKLSDISASDILTPVTVMFIENWVELKDDIVYQNLILQCLRSLNAVFKSNETGRTETQASYRWNDPSKNFTSHRLDQVSTALIGQRTTEHKAWSRPQTTQAVDTNINPLTFTKEDLKKRKQALIQGSGVVGKWVVIPVNPNITNYQETFTTHFNKYQRAPPPDFHTSISGGKLCPDPETIRRYNSVKSFR
ncbi:unnamed protein product [Blepharisma stoltei]|uniref:Uncharacterized protein n=1 Tax=Blepharisma stoltei TaxID=1481888 RepID=A0AAU9K2V4_9CILI|nr:unnamed protein product [Blepharisma stoltei]